MRAATRLRISGWLLQIGWALLCVVFGVLLADAVWVGWSRAVALWLTLVAPLLPGGCFLAALWIDSKIPVFVAVEDQQDGAGV